MKELEKSTISKYSCSAKGQNEKDLSLGIPSFLGLFLFTAGTSTIAIVLFIIRDVYQKNNGGSLCINEQPNINIANEMGQLLKSHVDEDSLAHSYQLYARDKENHAH